MNEEKKKVSFVLPRELYERLEEARWSRRKSLSAVLIEAVREYCARHDLPEPVKDAPKLPEQSGIPRDMTLPWEEF